MDLGWSRKSLSDPRFFRKAFLAFRRPGCVLLTRIAGGGDKDISVDVRGGVFYLFVPQCFNRIEAGGFHRGVEPG